MLLLYVVFFLYIYDNHRVLPVLSHSPPTRRVSELRSRRRAAAQKWRPCRSRGDGGAADGAAAARRCRSAGAGAAPPLAAVVARVQPGCADRGGDDKGEDRKSVV